MWHGCDAWLVLVQPASHMVAMGDDTCIGAGEGSGQLPETMYWNSLVAELADVFQPPGMPAEHDTMHRIKLEPGDMSLLRH